MKRTQYFQYLIHHEPILNVLIELRNNLSSENITLELRLAYIHKLMMENEVLMKILILPYMQILSQIKNQLCMTTLLILNLIPELISQGQYEHDHQSWLERGKDNQLNFHLNDSHHEYSITLITKSDLVPIILQKPKDDYSGIDLIHLGYISSPIDKSDQDALKQKIKSELKGQLKVFSTIIKYEKMILSFYEDDQ
ncbi:unnamed protein product (macronuclear) [Paramecium tetraurelia]|uniref:Uncharacterized protein n=1 Tax=Paramecium tetraurelia TaxID=5888 RepID=A0D4D3_PARTE|nr:uncharacterized protein GSPATT00013366001 [Paramecium tetraurelia]CAK77900.1 unnamed protein product [Paramecium tetraurelia]|eukprot:XP_001445297.1 hypothetical protein (macronuclear) [Paramecium tetraurelia strain d4-2]